MIPKNKGIYHKLPGQTDPSSSKQGSFLLFRAHENHVQLSLGLEKGDHWVDWHEFHHLPSLRGFHEQHVAANEHTSDHHDATPSEPAICTFLPPAE
jgi:hypothetical protein